MKKILAAGASAALFFALATPAFATFGPFVIVIPPQNSVKATNYANIGNTLNTSANTGYNGMVGSGFFGGVKNSSIGTGVASAGIQLGNDVNTTLVDTCGCLSTNKVKVEVGNTAYLSNALNTSANTGYNGMTGTGFFGGVSGSSIGTGGAGVSGLVANTVNMTVVGDLQQ